MTLVDTTSFSSTRVFQILHGSQSTRVRSKVALEANSRGILFLFLHLNFAMRTQKERLELSSSSHRNLVSIETLDTLLAISLNLRKEQPAL